MEICKRAQSILQKRRHATTKPDDDDSLSGMSEFDQDFDDSATSVTSIRAVSSIRERIVGHTAPLPESINRMNSDNNSDNSEIVVFDSDAVEQVDSIKNDPDNVDQDSEYISFDDDNLCENTASPLTIANPETGSQHDSDAATVSSDHYDESHLNRSEPVQLQDGNITAYSDDFEDAHSISSNVPILNDVDEHYDESSYSKDFESVESGSVQLDEELKTIQESFNRINTVHRRPGSLSSILKITNQKEKKEITASVSKRNQEIVIDQVANSGCQIHMSDAAVQVCEKTDQCIQVNRMNRFQGLFHSDPRLDIVPEPMSARLIAVISRLQASKNQLDQDRSLLSYKKYTTMRDIEAKIAKNRKRRG